MDLEKLGRTGAFWTCEVMLAWLCAMLAVAVFEATTPPVLAVVGVVGVVMCVVCMYALWCERRNDLRKATERATCGQPQKPEHASAQESISVRELQSVVMMLNEVVYYFAGDLWLALQKKTTADDPVTDFQLRNRILPLFVVDDKLRTEFLKRLRIGLTAGEFAQWADRVREEADAETGSRKVGA